MLDLERLVVPFAPVPQPGQGRRGSKTPPPVSEPLHSGQLLIFGQQAWVVVFLALVLLHVICYVLVTRVLSKSSRLASLKNDPQLAAHFLPQLVAFSACVYCGAGDWFFDMPDPRTTSISSYVPQGERIACLILGFQLYEFVMCIPCPRLRGGANELVVHHIISLVLSSLAYYKQAYLYYSPCFMGVAEISSLPLAFVDLFKQFPPLRALFPVANEMLRNVFAASFLLLRGVYWPICSVGFFRTHYIGWAAGAPWPMAAPIMYTFIFCNVAMTALQWYWSSIIVTAIVRLARGDPRHKEA